MDVASAIDALTQLGIFGAIVVVATIGAATVVWNKMKRG